MKTVGWAAALVAVATLLAGCSGGTAGVSASATAASAPAAGSSLPAAEFAAAAKLPGTVLLDVRTAQEFAEGHLPGAMNVDVESANFQQEVGALDKTLPYAVYCRSANRSKVAMTAMQQLGFTQVYDLVGGITAWKSAGGEVVTG